ncbi:chemotaxis protein CheB [Sphingobacteriaceae bacterium]|nr:chemotaxis protein CheB [Sphingobacteriaceae bacterium]
MEKSKITPPSKMLVIGGSAGSIEVILQVLPGLKKTLDFPIVIVLHRKSSADSSLSDLFSTRTELPVKEVDDKETISAGTIYLAPADYHLLFEKNNSFSLDFSEKVSYSRPSIDVSFESASDIYGKNLRCLLLSGANSDGVEGLRVTKKNGGQIVVQDPETAEAPFMPQHAINKGNVDLVLKPQEMVAFINGI